MVFGTAQWLILEIVAAGLVPHLFKNIWVFKKIFHFVVRFGALRCLSSLTHLFLAVLFWDGWLLIHSSWWYSVGFWRFPVFEPSSPGRYIFHHVLNSPSHRPGLFHHQNTKNVFGLFFLGGRKTLWGVLKPCWGVRYVYTGPAGTHYRVFCMGTLRSPHLYSTYLPMLMFVPPPNFPLLEFLNFCVKFVKGFSIELKRHV